MTQQEQVGIVVVSHSRMLARAAIALASEMVSDPIGIVAAAGLDDTTFGTDAVAIKEAIEQVDGPAGVLVLMDMGSALMAAELALELLDDPSARDRVTLSAAPIVEGLVVAAVAAAGGATRAEVAAEADRALLGKSAHLAAPEAGGRPEASADPQESGRPGTTGPPADRVVDVFTVTNPHGLHARPSARLVGEVRALQATVQLRNLTTGAGPVSAASLSAVATLGALRGQEVEVSATGLQARQAVEQLLALAARRFDEPDGAVASRQRPTEPVATGPVPTGPLPTGPLGASPGIGIGPVRRPGAAPVDVGLVESRLAAGDPASQWQRLVEAVAQVRRDTEDLRAVTSREVGPDQAGVFDAHLALLADPQVLADVGERVEGGVNAARAWAASLAEVESRWAALPDPYLRERAADVAAISQQVLRALAGMPARSTSGEGILVAPDLTPAEAATLDGAFVKGVVLAFGSATSHAAILARARDIPMVVAAGRGVLDLPDGTPVVIDGGSGELRIDPTPADLREFEQRARDAAERQAQDLALAEQPAVSRDGVRFHVVANLGSVADARAARSAGADGAGLVRTEFLFLGRSTAPDLEEQEGQYGAIAEAMAGRRTTFRTLDVGGDKPLPYLPLPSEDNPFLGLRGIRLSLDRPDLLREQLVAVCSTARRRPTSVMFPMVATVDELLAARRILVDAAGEPGLPPDLHVGMMVEVPAAALKIESFLPHVDFVSIGTNDLTQYTLAAERGNGAVATLSDALDPGVLRLIHRVCQAARGRVDVAVCGEVAADESAIPVLVGLGVRELSVAPHSVPGVKAALRRLDVGRCRALADQALTLAGAADVRSLVLTSAAELSE